MHLRVSTRSIWPHSHPLCVQFGGLGVHTTSTVGRMNDVWFLQDGYYTWVSGFTTAASAEGVYGGRGVFSPSYIPNQMWGFSMDYNPRTGTIWIFGGRCAQSVACLHCQPARRACSDACVARADTRTRQNLPLPRRGSPSNLR